jgi:hypothetical protein
MWVAPSVTLERSNPGHLANSRHEPTPSIEPDLEKPAGPVSGNITFEV